MRLSHGGFTSGDGLSVNASGKVGIGTAAPSVKLTLDGTYSSTNAGPNIEFKGTGTDAYPSMQILNYSHDDQSINFDVYYDGAWKSSDAGSNFQIVKRSDKFWIAYDSGIAAGSAPTFNTALLIDTTGNVGIGAATNLPAKLNIVGTGADGVAMLGMSESDQANIEFGFYGNFAGSGETGNSLYIGSGNGGAWASNIMTWRGDGKVGIGTTNPGSYKLYVNGTGYFASTLNINSQTGINITADCAGNVGYAAQYFYLDNSTSDATGHIRLARTAGTAFLGMEIAADAKHGIRFLTTDGGTLTERLKIDQNGSSTFAGHTNFTTITASAALAGTSASFSGAVAVGGSGKLSVSYQTLQNGKDSSSVMGWNARLLFSRK